MALDLQNKYLFIDENGTTELSPDSGYDGISGGSINVGVYDLKNSKDISNPYVSLNYRHFTGYTIPDDITGWENLTDGSYKLYHSPNLTKFDKPLPNLTNCYCMFSTCSAMTEAYTEINDDGEKVFSCPKLENATFLLLNCSGLTELNVNLPIATNLRSAFDGCSSLQKLKLICPNMNQYDINITYGCIALNEIYLDARNSDTFYTVFNTTNSDILPNLKKITLNVSNSNQSMEKNYNMFTGYTGITDIVIEGELNLRSLNFSRCVCLSKDSLLNILNALKDRTNMEPWDIYIGELILPSLTDEEIAIATNKNWLVL